MAEIVITEFMEQSAVSSLAADFDCLYDPRLVDDAARIHAMLADCRGLIVRNRTRVDAAMMDAAPNLRVIGRLGVGLDNIDLDAAAERGIRVCPATGANAACVAEYVLLATLHLLRPLTLATAPMLAGDFPRPAFSNGREIGGRVLGLIGGGMIGREVARRAIPLGMTVLVADPMLEHGVQDDGSEVVSLNECLSRADAVSLHIPLTPETAGMMSGAMLARMKPGSVLINTARGGIVDHAALARLMRDGRISGAALDVFDDEPASAESLAMFDGIENLILTPHIAGLTEESNHRVSGITADQVRGALEEG